MEDGRIVELFWARDERALAETAEKYGGRLRRLGQSLIRDRQTVEECDLVTVVVDGREFHLTRGMTFEANKRYMCTVEVTKTSEGVNVSIGDWEDDGTDYGGVAE